MIYYIAPTASGKGDGSSLANAATLSSLSALVEKAGPGDSILLLADRGNYTVTAPINLSAGGSADAPITIRGVDSDGNAMAATFVGNRADVYSPTAAQGPEVFRINAGADNLSFADVAFQAVNTAFHVTGAISNLTIDGATASNVNRFLDDYATAGQSNATISGLQISDVTVTGFAKGVIRLQYDTHDVVLDGVNGDSQFTDGANFAIGVSLGGTVHDVVVRNSSMGNVRDTTNVYYNGDGFATEAGAYDILFENVRAYNNTDAGFDIKSSSTTLVDTVSEGNTRNYRFWSDVTATGISSIEPAYHGGTGQASNFWIAGGNVVTLTDAIIADSSASSWLYDAEKSGARLVLDNVVSLYSATLSRVDLNGSTIVGNTTLAETADIPVPKGGEISGQLATYGIDIADSRLLTGGSSDDILHALSGQRYVFAGEGNDVLSDSATVKMLAGGSGDDSYVVHYGMSAVQESTDGGYDTVHTTLARFSLSDNVEKLVYDGTGAFTGFGNDGGNDLSGGDGNDTLYGRGGEDALRGGRGNDTLRGGDGSDYLDGNVGNDLLEGDAGNDLISSGAGDDVARGGSGDDSMSGDSGNDTLIGDLVTLSAGGEAAGKDYMEGNDGNDILYGDALTLTAKAAGSDDYLLGGSGDDILFGDALTAGSGAKMGNDHLYGGDGNDRLYGDAKTAASSVIGGSNWLEGGNGDDRLYGGSGVDIYAFNKGEQGADIISGFGQGTKAHDQIRLAGYGTDYTALDIEYSGGNAIVHLDAHQSVTVLGVSHLGASDFLLV